MNRLQKKCLIASTGTHAALFLTLLINSAFREKPQAKEESIQILEFIPARAVDIALAMGGGTPPPPAPTKPPETRPDPIPTPPPPEIKKIETPIPPPPEKPPEVKVEPREKPTPSPKEKEKPKEKPKEIVQAPKTTKTETNRAKIDLSKLINRGSTPKPETKARPDSKAQEAMARQEAARTAKLLGNVASIIRDQSSKATLVEMPGPGGGGEVYADYKSIVYTTYYQAWQSPTLSIDSEATTQAKIIIARDGSIVSYSIEKRSGNTALDKSVEAVLRRVEKIPLPFPEASKDTQRTFIINFNLKAKNLLG